MRLWNVPDDATRATAPGNLGPGGNYYQYTPETDQGATVLRQAYVTAQSGGFNATLGRFEWGEGVETLPRDADLLWLKKTRITERLVGPFGYTHAARTLDGARLWYDQPTWNRPAWRCGRPPADSRSSAGKELEEVSLLGLCASTKDLPWDAPADGRAFWFHYEDERVEDGRPVRVDNRPAGARAADSTMIRFDTFGLNLATVAGVGAARIDGLGLGRVAARRLGPAGSLRVRLGDRGRACTGRSGGAARGCAPASTSPRATTTRPTTRTARSCRSFRRRASTR